MVIIIIIVIIEIMIHMTMFMMLSLCRSHCESSPSSFDECRMAPSGRRPKTKPDDLGHQPTYRMPESTPTEVLCIKKPKPHIWKTFRMQTELNHGPYRMRTEPEPKLLSSFPSLPATHRHHHHSSTEAQGWRSNVIVRSVIHSVCLSAG